MNTVRLLGAAQVLVIVSLTQGLPVHILVLLPNWIQRGGEDIIERKGEC